MTSLIVRLQSAAEPTLPWWMEASTPVASMSCLTSSAASEFDE